MVQHRFRQRHSSRAFALLMSEPMVTMTALVGHRVGFEVTEGGTYSVPIERAVSLASVGWSTPQTPLRAVARRTCPPRLQRGSGRLQGPFSGRQGPSTMPEAFWDRSVAALSGAFFLAACLKAATYQGRDRKHGRSQSGVRRRSGLREPAGGDHSPRIEVPALTLRSSQRGRSRPGCRDRAQRPRPLLLARRTHASTLDVRPRQAAPS
jgi:hypothetical protein